MKSSATIFENSAFTWRGIWRSICTSIHTFFYNQYYKPDRIVMIGIDAGTKSTDAVGANKRGEVMIPTIPTLPSVVAWETAGKKKCRGVGEEALALIGRTDVNDINIKWPINGIIEETDGAKNLLMTVINKVLGPKGEWAHLKYVLISVPFGTRSESYMAVMDNIEKQLRVPFKYIYQGTLAAIDLGILDSGKEGRLLVDCGGNTVQIFVFVNGEILSGVTFELGGNNTDKDIKDYLEIECTHIKYEVDVFDAEGLKKDASEVTTGTLKFHAKVGGHPARVEREISVYEIDAILKRNSKIIANEVYRVIKNLNLTHPKLVDDISLHGIDLSGGSAQLKFLTESITLITGIKATVGDDPRGCVARGILKVLGDPNKISELEIKDEDRPLTEKSLWDIILRK